MGVRLPVAREPVRARRGRGNRAGGAGGGDSGGGGRRRLARTDGGVAPPTPTTTLASSSAYARVGYRFTRAPEGLKLGRVLIAGDGGESPLDGTLGALVVDPARAARVQIEERDLQADRLLGTGSQRAVLSPGKLDGLMQILAGAPGLTLDGRPIVMSDEELLPQSTLTDGAALGGGAEVRLLISADPRVRAVVSVGVALGEEDGRTALYRLGETELAGGPWLRGLPRREVFPAAALGELVTKLLPDLARRTMLDVRSRRLPPVVRDLAPRVVLRLDQIAGGLSVLPTLVYGSPPVARIDARPPGSPARAGADPGRAVGATRARAAAQRAWSLARAAHELYRRGRASLRRQAEAVARRSLRRRGRDGQTPGDVAAAPVGGRRCG